MKKEQGIPIELLRQASKLFDHEAGKRREITIIFDPTVKQIGVAFVAEGMQQRNSKRVNPPKLSK